MMISTALDARPVQATAVKIIHDQNLSHSQLDLCRGLCASLTKASCQVSMSLWEDEHPDGPIYLIADFSAMPLLRDSSNKQFHRIKLLLAQVTHVLWVTCQGPSSDLNFHEGGLLTGFSRVARSENETLKLVTLDIQQCGDKAQMISAIGRTFAHSFLGSSDTVRSGELAYIYREDQISIPRLVPAQGDVSRLVTPFRESAPTGHEPFHQVTRPLQLQVESPGSLDSLVFHDCKALQKPLQDNELEIHVEACGLNFKDVFIALGRMKARDRMAGECAGYVVSVGRRLHPFFKVGDRVCAWNATSYASRARVTSTDACILPDSMSYTIAASIPVVFATAYYSIVDVANLQRGQTILIHAASGGVGQAALIIAQWLGAVVFVTVGSTVKRDLIVAKYKVPATHIFSSRALNFKKGIMRLTKGKGVDVILNSLSGEALQDSWECIASFGTFIEIGKSDIYRKGQISMAPFDRHVSFVSVDLGRLSEDKPEVSRTLLAKVVRLFEEGILRPVEPVTVIPMTEIEEAFRKIQSRSHLGKVVLEAGNRTMVKARNPQVNATQLNSNGTYVVAGGLGSLGRPICRFLANHGAKNILILSRSSPDAETQAFFEFEVESLGTRVMVLQCDITDSQQVTKAALECNQTMLL